MSTERDELAEVIATAIDEWFGEGDPNEYVAHAVRAAGYRKPRTVTTAEELDALPVGSVVLAHADGHDIDCDALWAKPHPYHRGFDGFWYSVIDGDGYGPRSFFCPGSTPVTLLHEGSPE